MGATCVRCSRPIGEPASGALCDECRARLRILLAARAGVRRAGERSLLGALAVASVLTLALVLGLLRQFGSVAAEPMRQQHGVWQILGGATFISPVGMAADRMGNLYVVDAANSRIDKLAPDGTLLATLGSRGNAPGQLDRPTAVALDPIGNVYVADTANSRIEKLSVTGVPLGTWGSFGSGPGQFNGPHGVAVDHEGNVYVGDTGNDRVQKLSPFKPEHVKKYPEIHEYFWRATKLAGEAKHSVDPAKGQELLDAIQQIDKVFWETKE